MLILNTRSSNVTGDLSVSQTIVSTDLSASTIKFTNIVGNMDGAQITGGVGLVECYGHT